jgi:hypothetical protein
MKELFPHPVTPITRTATSSLISFLIASGLRGLGASCIWLCNSVRMLESRDPMADPLTGEAGGDAMAIAYGADEHGNSWIRFTQDHKATRSDPASNVISGRPQSVTQPDPAWSLGSRIKRLKGVHVRRKVDFYPYLVIRLG